MTVGEGATRMADSAAATEMRQEVDAGARAALLASLAGKLIARRLYDLAEPVLRLALTLDAQSFAARFALSEALAAMDRSPEALEQGWLAYATARRGTPPDLVPLPETEAACAMLEAARETVLPDPRLLAPGLALCAAQRPGEAWLPAHLGALHLAHGAPAEAALWFRRAAAIDARFDTERAAALARCGNEPRYRCAGVADEPALADALRRVGLGTSAEVLCEKLAGGAQNQMIKLTTGDRAYALRLEKFPSAGWYFYAEEANNAGLAHGAGLSPALFYFDRADGTALMEFLPGATMTEKGFAAPDKAAAAGALYRRLHGTAGFLGSYDILAMIESDRAARAGVCPPELADLAALEAAYQTVRALLLATRGPPCATHNDPIPQNFIAQTDGLMLLDWQCSASADPHWEIGAFSAQNALPPPAEDAFLAAYFDEADIVGRARVRLMKPVCSFFWLGRALIRGQQAADDKWQEEALGNARRLRELLAEPVFAESVAVLEAAKS